MFITQRLIKTVISLILQLFGAGDDITKSTILPSSTTPTICTNADCQITTSPHPASVLLPAECGIPRPEGRIVKGKEAYLGQFPWIARIGYKRKSGIKFQCGATLINEWFVVTAAHCLKGQEAKVQTIRFGEHIASLEIDCEGDVCAPPVQDIEPADIVVHPSYPLGSRYDIAIIKLKTKVTLNEFVQPICLPLGSSITDTHLNEMTTVAGWGIVDSSTEDRADVLMYVGIPVREREVCDKLYSPVKLDESQLCVGVDTGEDSCTGDSGGPLMNIDKDKYNLLGVVSFGKAYCGETPSVYTNVVFFMDWILDNIGKLSSDSVTTESSKSTTKSGTFLDILVS